MALLRTSLRHREEEGGKESEAHRLMEEQWHATKASLEAELSKAGEANAYARTKHDAGARGWEIERRDWTALVHSLREQVGRRELEMAQIQLDGGVKPPSLPISTPIALGGDDGSSIEAWQSGEELRVAKGRVAELEKARVLHGKEREAWEGQRQEWQDLKASLLHSLRERVDRAELDQRRFARAKTEWIEERGEWQQLMEELKTVPANEWRGVVAKQS